ncbi:MAG: TspO/MBR family protein [Acutalibacteraceae bacterium]|nr:TspO/MBR family protein [Acutalibacteraceae bacterium]
MTITSNIKWKPLLVNIIIPLAVGTLAGLVTREGMQDYNNVIKPSLSPPDWLFPIVWTILYTLMGISTYLIYNKDDNVNKTSFIIYAFQLAINFIWPILFFGFKAYLFAFIIIIILILLVSAMIFLFYKENIIAAKLQVPYLIWLLFAAYLNISVYLLN